MTMPGPDEIPDDQTRGPEPTSYPSFVYNEVQRSTIVVASNAQWRALAGAGIWVVTPYPPAAPLTMPFEGELIPVVTALDPASATVGDPPFLLHVTGIGFASDATVLVNGVALPTRYVSDTALTALIDPAGSDAAPLSVAVANGPGSNTLMFDLQAPPPPPEP